MYSPEEIAQAKATILKKVAEGLSLEAILRADEDMELPGKTKIYQWMQASHKDFDEQFTEDYERARDLRADKIFEDILDIADDGSNDTYIDPESGKTFTDYDVVQRSKLRIDARKWYLARMKPKKFGDKIETTIQGGDKPIETVNYKTLSDGALEEIVKNAQDAAEARSQ